MALITNRNVPWGDSLIDLHRAAGPGSTIFVEPFSYDEPIIFRFGLYGTERQRSFDLPVDTLYGAAAPDARTGLAGLSLSIDAARVLSGGTVRVLVHSADDTVFDVEILGIRVPVTGAGLLETAIASPTTADDRLFVQRLLTGNDLAVLSTRNDRFLADFGNDLIFGNDGNDTIRLGPGNDAAVGDHGRDRLSGQAGDDLLAGCEGADRLDGGGGRDTLDGGRGDDVLTGGPGADVFEFKRADGTDRITDFRPGTDVINISSGAARFGRLSIVQEGADVRIAFAATVVILEGQDAADIGRAAFTFGPDPSAPHVSAVFLDTPFMV